MSPFIENLHCLPLQENCQCYAVYVTDLLMTSIYLLLPIMTSEIKIILFSVHPYQT